MQKLQHNAILEDRNFAEALLLGAGLLAGSNVQHQLVQVSTGFIQRLFAVSNNTGVIADGEKSIDEAAKDLLDLVIRVASGEQTKAEKHGFREISIFKDGVVL